MGSSVSVDLDPGSRAVGFLNRLTHTGDFNGKPFELRPWQADIVRRLFGSVRPDGKRQYRRAFLALPRKQGKTELAAGVLLYLLLGTGRKGQRIYSASGDHNQAGLIFKAAQTMIRNDPILSRICSIQEYKKRISVQGMDNVYEALSSEADLKHGLNPSAVLFDEVHVLTDGKGRNLHEVLTTGFGARDEPLTWYITTAGWDRRSLCYELWDYARRVRDGVVVDPTFLPVLYEAGPSDDWTDEAVWRRAMPALGDFCSLEFIADECRRAQGMPQHENTFRQLYLNQWTEQAVRWISTDRWDACGVEPVDLSDLEGRLCYGGLDLSQSRDLTALAFVFPDEDSKRIRTIVKAWAPEFGSWRDEPANRDKYLAWARAGYLELIPGEVIDQDVIEAAVVDAARTYELRSLFTDPWQGTQLAVRLEKVYELPVKFFKQTFGYLNDPTRELERLVLAGNLHHGGNPVLASAIANAAVERDATGLIRLNKGKSSGRIDPAAALVNALGAFMADIGGGTSVYDDRGILVL